MIWGPLVVTGKQPLWGEQCPEAPFKSPCWSGSFFSKVIGREWRLPAAAHSHLQFVPFIPMRVRGSRAGSGGKDCRPLALGPGGSWGWECCRAPHPCSDAGTQFLVMAMAGMWGQAGSTPT